jgi:hypothetical protein
MKLMTVFIISGAIILTACDPNSKPTFGEETCRAIVQQNIDAYRAKQFTADEIMASLERNCGTYGSSWGQ